MSTALKNSPGYPFFNSTWNEFMELQGNQWPDLALKKLYSSNVGYKDRCFIAAHGYQNALTWNNLSKLLKAVNHNYTVAKGNQMQQLYKYFATKGEQGKRIMAYYYAYDVVIGRVCYLNKKIKI